MKNTLAFADVVVGDVWLAAGQSNMEFGIQDDRRAKEAIGQAVDSQIRLFFVPWTAALEPRTDLGPVVPRNPLNGKWLVCTPEIMRADWAWHGFSAVGYYFAVEIRRVTGRPVGMIGAYKGATGAQAWTSVAGLAKDASLAEYVIEHQRIVAGFAQATALYPKQLADYQAAMVKWSAAKTAGHAAAANNAPVAPPEPDGGCGASGNLFNGMVAPLIPFAFKGVIWYQGESNGNSREQGREYAVLFPRMISDWREKWGRGNFPFLFVQMPNFGAPSKTPSEGYWPWLREAQSQTLSLPATGMAVTIDLGDAANLHPSDKLPVARRLAFTARHVAYGENLVYSGPVYDSMTIEGGRIRLHFKNSGRGLALGNPPPGVSGEAVQLTGFGIAGANRKWTWAKAALDGEAVVVSSEQVPQPVAVRYDWGQNPPGNLSNQEGLPASPFRTDAWPPAK